MGAQERIHARDKRPRAAFHTGYCVVGIKVANVLHSALNPIEQSKKAQVLADSLAIVNFACYGFRPESGPQMGKDATHATHVNLTKLFIFFWLNLN